MNDLQIIEKIKENKMSITDVLFALFQREVAIHPSQKFFTEPQLKLINKAFKLIESSKTPM